MSPKPIVVVINGLPGVGKLTVAHHLSKLLTDCKVFDNHLLIDVAASLYQREDEAYLPLRRALRAAVFASLRSSSSIPPILVFTECQSTDTVGSAVRAEYAEFARSIGAALLSVVLECEDGENEQRLVHPSRAGVGRTKLLDVGVLRRMREGASFSFGQQATVEWVIDTSSREAGDVASELSEKIKSHVVAA